MAPIVLAFGVRGIPLRWSNRWCFGRAGSVVVARCPTLRSQPVGPPTANAALWRLLADGCGCLLGSGGARRRGNNLRGSKAKPPLQIPGGGKYRGQGQEMFRRSCGGLPGHSIRFGDGGNLPPPPAAVRERVGDGAGGRARR